MVAANTIGAISKRTKLSLHQVEYLIRSRGIQPAGRAGTYRLFDEDAVALIERESRQIHQKKRAIS